MGWINLSSHKQVVTRGTEEKGFYPNESFAGYLFNRDIGDIGSSEAVRMYYQCKPLFHAIKKRSLAFSSVQPRIWDVRLKEFVDDHPVLQLLKHPNPFQSYESWAMELSEFYDVTGNSFTTATGNINNAPLELFVERPQAIDLNDGKNTFYFPETITVSSSSNSRVYNLKEQRREGINTARYIRGTDQEIWHIKDVNLSYYISGLWGISRAQPIWLEIQQYIESNINNLSILKRGGRPSMIWKWMHDQPMTDPQFVRARDELKKYEGSINAGRQVIADHIEPSPVAMNQKDMQFSENRATVEENIYTIYDIPLAMIISKSMTLDNLKTSELLFWRDAILPLAGMLFGELTRFLLPRYGNIGAHRVMDMKLTLNPFDIEPLRAAKIRETRELGEISILTDNELRSEIGYEEFQGGDTIYKPLAVQPVGEDGDTSTNLEEPLVKSSKFIENLMELRRVDGTTVFDADFLAVCQKEINNS